MTPAEARALFPVLERLAYLNAGTFGPVAQPTADAVRAQLDDELERRPLRARSTSSGCSALRVEARAALALARRRAAGARVADRLDDGRVQHRPRRPRSRPGGRDRDHARGALRPARAAARERRPRRRRRRRAGGDPRGGDAADAPARALAGALDDRPRAAGAGASRADRRARARRRGAVGRRDPRRRGRARLPDDLRPEVALRAGRDGRARRRRPGAACASPGRATSRRPPTRRRAATSRPSEQPASTPAGSRPRASPGSWPRSSCRRSGASSAPRRWPRAAGSCWRRSSSVVPADATLVAFRAEDPPALVATLFDAGVVVRDLPGTGLVRVSCGWWTNDDDLDRLAAAL